MASSGLKGSSSICPSLYHIGQEPAQGVTDISSIDCGLPGAHDPSDKSPLRALRTSVRLAAAEAQPERALRLSAAAANLLESIGAVWITPWKDSVEFDLNRARRLLSTDAALAAEEQGKRMAVEHAIVYALVEERIAGSTARRRSGL
jgi:hypothetical protein